MRLISGLLLLLLLTACQPAPEPPTPTADLADYTPFPAVTLTPGTHPAPPEDSASATPLPYPLATADMFQTRTPEPYPLATAYALPFEQESPPLPTILGDGQGIIFPILWYQPPLGKRGLAWHTTVCTDATELGVSWYFNWDTRRNSCPPSLQPAAYYPIWRPTLEDRWYQRINADYDGIALFLNEPNWTAQDNVTAAEAAHLYRQFQTTICPGCKTIVLNLAWADTGYLIEWRETYRAAYGEYPAVFAYGMHVYGSEDRIISQVELYRETLVAIGEGDKQIWLTEYGGCWQGEQPFAHQLTPDEMSRVLAQFEAWDWLEGYAFFGVRWYKPGDPPPEGLHCDALFTPEGITELGETYAAPPQGYP